jgi:hypothetical protein
MGSIPPLGERAHHDSFGQGLDRAITANGGLDVWPPLLLNRRENEEPAMRKTYFVSTSLWFLVGALTNVPTTAQDAKSSQAPQYVYEVWGTSTREPNKPRPWSEPLETEAQAEARIRELRRSYGKGGLRESSTDKPTGLVVRKKVKGGGYVDADKDNAEAKKGEKELAKGYANEAAEKLSKELKERKPGSTLQEYSRRIADTYRNATGATKYLTSFTGTVTQKQFQDVNNLIDSFNRMRSDFRDKAGAEGAATLSSYPLLARVTPQDLKGKLAADATTGKWIVWVFKRRDGKWEKQEDQSFSSDDQNAAENYLNASKKREGYTVTSNLPRKAIDLAGTTWTAATGDFWQVFRFEGGGHLGITSSTGTTLVIHWQQMDEKVYVSHLDDAGRILAKDDCTLVNDNEIRVDSGLGSFFNSLKRNP